ncbi:hypothetical protein JB92DRAFT_3114333 [Gautieria morchelliformis]|nr:hypothetical protein JB92DRAFT_3114333 [Gautieria morchelliformis]
MLPDGISDDGELNNDATPDGEVEGNLESWGLAVLGAKGTLWFCEEWNNERLDEWLREILPKPFSFLDNEYGVPADAKKRHWRLLESSRKRLKKHRSVADGYAFKEVKGTAAAHPGDPDIWVWDDEDFPEPSSLLSDDKWANKPTTRSQTLNFGPTNPSHSHEKTHL